MNVIEQKFQDEIEVERLWLASEHGSFTFFSMLPVAVLIVVGFWDAASHIGLIVWFVVNRAINFARWMIFSYYHERREKLTVGINKFKNLVLSVSILHGLSWAVFVFWFLSPFDPTKFLLVSLALIIEIMGALLFWYSFLPALIAITLPITVALVSVLILQDSQICLIAAVIVFIACLLGFISSIKLSEVLKYSLFLYFENAALRKESEEKSLLLETALENMGQAISMTDNHDRLRMWNRQFIKFLGEAGDKVGTDVQLDGIWQMTQPPVFIGANDRAEYRTQDGLTYEIRQSALKLGGRVLTYTDISDLIKREEALEKARKEAEQANVAKTRFLAVASHDLRQPIHALGLFFAELSDRVYSPETALVIRQVEDSIEAINSMLNALLDVSKLDAGVVKPVIEPFGLTDLFERLQAEFQPIALENRNELRIRPTLASVDTDPAMLERMLRNLIGNALRYTENGRVLVAARPRGAVVDCQIWDNGSGIPKDQLEDIFIEFHQLQNPARDRRRGLGLGLAIVKRLANLLQHDIKVASHFGRGSCFSLTLPLASKTTTREAVKLSEKACLPNNSLFGLDVLVLDDDISVLESMHGLLSHWGCRVITAGSPSEAVDKVAVSLRKPQLLIIDYRLTDNVSGIDVARNLQNRFGYPIAVLIITGDTAPERLRDADASGFPLLHKPVQPAKLRSTLQFLMSKLRAGNT